MVREPEKTTWKDWTGPSLKLAWSPPNDRTGPSQTSKAHDVTRQIFFRNPENPKSTGMPHSTLFSVAEKHSLDRNSLDRGLCYLLLCKIEKIA